MSSNLGTVYQKEKEGKSTESLTSTEIEEPETKLLKIKKQISSLLNVKLVSSGSDEVTRTNEVPILPESQST